MAKLSAADRKKIAPKNFALSGRQQLSALNVPPQPQGALQRVSQFGTSSEKATVRKKVHEKYPAMASKHEGVKRATGGANVTLGDAVQAFQRERAKQMRKMR